VGAARRSLNQDSISRSAGCDGSGAALGWSAGGVSPAGLRGAAKRVVAASDSRASAAGKRVVLACEDLSWAGGRVSGRLVTRGREGAGVPG
jgi:hypothetical protein